MAIANPVMGTAAAEAAPDGAGSVAVEDALATEAEKPKFGRPSAPVLVAASAPWAFDAAAAVAEIVEEPRDCVPLRAASAGADDISVGGVP